MGVMEGIRDSTLVICVTILLSVFIVSAAQCERERQLGEQEVRKAAMEVHKAAIEKSDSGTIVFTDDNGP